VTSRRFADGGRLFWVTAAVGWVVIAYGTWGLLDESDRTAPASVGRWLAGGLLAHDLLVAPLAAVVSALLARVVPASWRRPVLWATATSVLLGVVAWPLVRGYGRDPENPSLLPRNYGAGLLAYVALTWAAAAVWAVVATRRTRARARRVDRP
jgi:hypothetical protein